MRPKERTTVLDLRPSQSHLAWMHVILLTTSTSRLEQDDGPPEPGDAVLGGS